MDNCECSYLPALNFGEKYLKNIQIVKVNQVVCLKKKADQQELL
jgi:hypothetical protein